MKTQDIPTELRPFWEDFRKMEYHFDYAMLFDDFLTAMFNGFVPPGTDVDVSCFEKYEKNDRLLLMSMAHTMLKIYQTEIKKRDWYDPLGSFYEVLSSRGKRSSLGQFFTPHDVVKLMTQITHGEGETPPKGKSVFDSCAGSARMLLCFHQCFPGNYTYAQDIDFTCCKMSAINMLVHGCIGEVVWGDSLDADSYRRGWKINAHLRTYGIPTILPIQKEYSVIYKVAQAAKAREEKAYAEAVRKAEEEEAAKRQQEQEAAYKKYGQQLTFGDESTQPSKAPEKTKKQKPKKQANKQAKQTPGTQGHQLKFF